MIYIIFFRLDYLLWDTKWILSKSCLLNLNLDLVSYSNYRLIIFGLSWDEWQVINCINSKDCIWMNRGVISVNDRLQKKKKSEFLSEGKSKTNHFGKIKHDLLMQIKAVHPIQLLTLFCEGEFHLHVLQHRLEYLSYSLVPAVNAGASTAPSDYFLLPPSQQKGYRSLLL